MSHPLVHVINSEILKRQTRSSIRGLGLDLDGTIYPVDTPEISNLMWHSVLSFLDSAVVEPLRQYSFDNLQQLGDYKLWWFLDRKEGYLVLVDSDDRLIDARVGGKRLPERKIRHTYGRGKVPVDQALDLDHNRPRFIPLHDGFDHIEGIIKAAVLRLDKFEPRHVVKKIDDALYKAHNHPHGFKRDILAHPESYGIVPNPELAQYLSDIDQAGIKPFVVSNSPDNYVRRILEIMDLTLYMHAIHAPAKKPACFSPEREEYTELKQVMSDLGIEDPTQVLYLGDHLYKDCVLADDYGWHTGLVIPGKNIGQLARRLVKHAGFVFDNSPQMAILQPPSQVSLMRLKEQSRFLNQVYDHVDVVTSSIEGTRPILLQ